MVVKNPSYSEAPRVCF